MKIVVALFLLFGLNNLWGQTFYLEGEVEEEFEVYELDYHNLKGPVKYIALKPYRMVKKRKKSKDSYKELDLTNPGAINTEMYFDQEGRLQKDVSHPNTFDNMSQMIVQENSVGSYEYSQTGKLARYEFFGSLYGAPYVDSLFYDILDNLIAKKTYVYGMLNWNQEMVYDLENRIKEASYFDKDVNYNKAEYVYLDSTYELKFTNPAYKMEHEAIRTYDNEGRLLSFKGYDPVGKVSVFKTFDRNAEGLLVRYTYQKVNDDTLKAIVNSNEPGRIIFEYDKSGNKVNCEFYRQAGYMYQRESTEYNEAGYIVKKMIFKGDSESELLLDSQVEFSYDASFNQIEKKSTFFGLEKEVVYLDVLEYDSQGNWILKNSYQEGLLVYVNERTIEYY